MERYSKRPSMIPRLATLNKVNRNNTLLRDEQLPTKQTNKHNASEIPQTNKTVILEENKKISPSTIKHNQPKNIFSLQQQLKETIAIINQKFGISQKNYDTSIANTIPNLSNTDVLKILFNNISQMKETASILSTTNDFKYQKTHIENLIKNISEIQGITNNLIENEGKSGNSTLDLGSTVTSMNKVQLQITDPKRESQVSATDSLSKKTDKNLKEENLKTTDSMDGVFIPSCEPPINIDDDDEANDSEITSDIKNLLIHPVESSITLRLSDLSVEGIKTLKKCPKEFKFRMDIIQGRLVFQPGKQPISKFPLVPDFSYTEITLDEKASEMISIKPSTECIFTSQLIPVDNGNIESFSSKSINLRAVVSEIFTVVNMPLKNRNKSLNTVTKSCGTFTDESLSLPNNEHVMSMPEMTGVANDLEEPNLKNLNVLDGDSSSKDNAALYVT